MKPAPAATTGMTLAALCLLATVVGCASLRGRNESIIHVQASRNPAEAARLTLVGSKALDHGEIDRATDNFLNAIDADPSYGPAHNNLGLMHYEQGNLYQAALAFEQAMDLMPQDPVVYYNLALTLESAGRVFEAMDLYTQAVEMDSVNPFFLGNLCRLRVRMGEDDPSLIAQLQDLALIETRPEWRRWADRQLALTYNIALDRGPAAPDFESEESRKRGSAERDVQNQIIDLSPPLGETDNPPRGGAARNRTDALPPGSPDESFQTSPDSFFPNGRDTSSDAPSTDEVENTLPAPRESAEKGMIETPAAPEPAPPQQAPTDAGTTFRIDDRGSLNALPPSIGAIDESDLPDEEPFR